jgi:cobalt-zinc-cadmium efflux system outer membrane protein
MKAIRICLFTFLAIAARAEDPFARVDGLLPQQHTSRTHAARPFTLPEIESSALQNNPEIRIFVRRVSIAEARIGGAGSLEDASFMYRGWGVPLTKPWNFNQAQNMFMVAQPFPSPGKRSLRSQLASQDVEIAKAELEAKKREVLTELRLAFHELLRNYEELRLHEEQVALARQGFESARIKYTVGRVPQQDVLKAQIAISKLVDHLIMFQQEGQLARAKLNSLMGRDPGAPLEVTGEYAIPVALPRASELQQEALAKRPELLMISAAIRRSETQGRLAQKAYTPDFNVGAGYMRMPSGSEFRNTYMAELSINLPWLNRRRHESEIAATRSEVSTLQAEYDAQRTVVFHQIQEAVIRADAARRLVELYRDTLRPQSQTTLRATAAAYETDRTDFLNLIDSQNMALDVEYAYFRALSTYEQRLADLERAIGAPIPRSNTQARRSEAQ